MPFKITIEQVVEVLREQNPWHSVASMPKELAPVTRRPLAQAMPDALQRQDLRRFQLVLGPRRVGKTALMYQTVETLLQRGVRPDRLAWLRVDHPMLMDTDLGSLVKAMLADDASDHDPMYVFIDELTYAKDWDRWLKTFYDERWPIRLLATSSASAALRSGYRESGVGRWEEQFLSPYSFVEALKLQGADIGVVPDGSFQELITLIANGSWKTPSFDDVLRRYLLVGGFPELLRAGGEIDEQTRVLRSQATLRSEAVQRAVYQDLPQTFGIKEPVKLERLLYVLGGQMCGLLRSEQLAKDISLAQPTVDQYIKYLEEAFLIFVLNNYAGSEESVQRRGKKVYFFDGAVRNAALQRGLRPLSDDGEFGVLRENCACAQLRALGEQALVRVFHWRRGTDEVDLVYADHAAPMAFEIGSDSRHPPVGLRAIAEVRGFAGRTYLVYPRAHPRPSQSDGTPGVVPLDGFLLAAGVAAERAMRMKIGII